MAGQFRKELPCFVSGLTRGMKTSVEGGAPAERLKEKEDIR
jgi:hypothetical protein